MEPGSSLLTTHAPTTGLFSRFDTPQQQPPTNIDIDGPTILHPKLHPTNSNRKKQTNKQTHKPFRIPLPHRRNCTKKKKKICPGSPNGKANYKNWTTFSCRSRSSHSYLLRRVKHTPLLHIGTNICKKKTRNGGGSADEGVYSACVPTCVRVCATTPRDKNANQYQDMTSEYPG